MNAKNPLYAYRETQIRTAGPGRLIVMMYDEAIKQIKLGIEYCGMNNPLGRPVVEKVHGHIVKAQDVVTELMASLDFDQGGEIAKNLFSLYIYVNKQLFEGNLKKDTKILENVLPILVELRGAWAAIADMADTKQSSAPGVNIAG